MGGLSRKHIVQGCEASLRRLGMETIDLYQIHRFDPHTPIDEMLSAPRSSRAAGQGALRRRQLDGGLAIRQGAERFGAAWLGAVRDDAEPLQPPLSRGRARDDPAVRVGGRGGDSVVAAGARAAGRHAAVAADAESTRRAETDDFARKLYDQPSDQDVIDAVRHVAKARGVPPARVALAWLLSKPAVAAPIIGATKLPHLDDAVAALELELSAEEVNGWSALRPHPVAGSSNPQNTVRSEEGGVRREDKPARPSSLLTPPSSLLTPSRRGVTPGRPPLPRRCSLRGGLALGQLDHQHGRPGVAQQCARRRCPSAAAPGRSAVRAHDDHVGAGVAAVAHDLLGRVAFEEDAAHRDARIDGPDSVRAGSASNGGRRPRPLPSRA